MVMQLVSKRALDSPAIPDRLYFKIGDVARLCEVETYVLRFWETQFPQLKPNKSGSGQRLYRRRDVELALKIKRLVHIEGYTLAGARQALEPSNRRPALRTATGREPDSRLPLLEASSGKPLFGEAPEEVAAAVARARVELREIADLLAVREPIELRRRPRLATMPPTSDSLFPV